MLAGRRKIIFNYYLFLGLMLIAQAFFTVFAGNMQIGHNQQLSAMDNQRQSLEKEVAAIENEIALNQSLLKQKEAISTDEFIEITQREVIRDRQTPVLAVAN